MEQINPILEAFLDTDSFEEKYKILVANTASDFDDLLIDNMASAMDLVINEGPREMRLQDLKNCVRTRAHYETARLRR